MKINIFLMCLCSLFLFTGCNTNEFGDNGEPDTSEEGFNLNEEQIGHSLDVYSFMKKMFGNTTTLSEDDIVNCIEKLKKMPDVADAFLSESTDIIIKMDWGASFIYMLDPYPVWDYSENFQDEEYSVSSKILLDTRVSECNPENYNGKTVAIGVGPDMKKNRVWIESLKLLGKRYCDEGFKVDFYLDKDFNKDFLQNKIRNYDVSIILAHGRYDGGNSNIGNHHISYEGEYETGENCIALNRPEPLLNSEYTYKNYPALTESEWPKGNFKENSTVFLISCEQLKGNDNLWKNFKNKNVGALLAFDNGADIDVGIQLAGEFSKLMLSGNTVKDAYSSMNTKRRGFDTEDDKKKGIYTYYNLILNTTNPDIKFVDRKIEEDDIRKYLVKLYEDTDGDHWNYNFFWLSDRPVEYWYGVNKLEDGSYNLYLSLNNLKGTINISGCSEIKELWCEDNLLTNINVSECIALRGLWCDNNRLTSLDVSGCTALKNLWCENNFITSEIPETFKQLEYFVYDQLYEYYTDWSEFPYKRKYIKNDYGWYYPGEPESGRHDWPSYNAPCRKKK